MRVEKVWLLNYLKQKGCVFKIPVYQRNYSWATKQVGDLMDDISKVIEKKKNHFFGTMVSFVDETDGSLNIIDGQQRLTTVSLIMIAMKNMKRTGEIVCNNDIKYDEIFDCLNVEKERKLELKNNESAQKLKLVPFRNDMDVYNSIYNSDFRLEEKDSNLLTNYRYIDTFLHEKKYSLDQVMDALRKFELVSIKLEVSDDPQEVFESLNSTGLVLNESDKIRNFILMGVESSKQEEWYDKYWKEIEANTGFVIDEFMRCYLNINGKRQNVKRTEIYTEFKSYIKEKSADREADITEFVLQQMKQMAIYFNKLNSAKTEYETANQMIKEMQLVGGYNEMLPFILHTYIYVKNGIFTEGNIFSKTCTILRDYLVRTSIVGNKAGLRKNFERLMSSIIFYENDDETNVSKNFLNKLVYALKTDVGKASYPDNIEFKDRFEEIDIFKSKNLAKYVLCYLNQNYEGEVTDVTEQEYEIEHILPKERNQTWMKDLGQQQYESAYRCVDRIGNLTLLKNANKITGKTFEDKKNDEVYGYRRSGLKINNYLLDKQIWNRDQINKRSRVLAVDACEIWKDIGTDYKPLTRKTVFNLNEDIESVKRKPIMIKTSKGTHRINEDWGEAFVCFCKDMRDWDSYRFKSIARQEDYSKIFSSEKETTSYTQISKDIYVIGKRSDNVIEVMRNIAREMNVDLTTIEIGFNKFFETEELEISEQSPLEKMKLLKVGNTVKNKVYGYGKITKIEETEGSSRVYIRFVNYPEEKIYLKNSLIQNKDFELKEEED